MTRAEYQRRHKLVRKERGPARGHQCSRCGNPARDWAQIHGTNGEDPLNDYEPMCRSCHEKYDQKNTGRKRTAEERAKISDAKKGVALSEDHKRAIGNSIRGIKRSDETRHRMSEAARRRWARVRENTDGADQSV